MGFWLYSNLVLSLPALQFDYIFLLLFTYTVAVVGIGIFRMTEKISDECEKHKGGWLTG